MLSRMLLLLLLASMSSFASALSDSSSSSSSDVAVKAATPPPTFPASPNGIPVQLPLMVGLPVGLFSLALAVSVVLCHRGSRRIPGESLLPATPASLCCCSTSTTTTLMIKLRQLSITVGLLSTLVVCTDWMVFFSGFVYPVLVALLFVSGITYNSTGSGFATSQAQRHIRFIRWTVFISAIVLFAGAAVGVVQVGTLFVIYYVFALFFPLFGAYVLLALGGMLSLAFVLLEFNATLLLASRSAGSEMQAVDNIFDDDDEAAMRGQPLKQSQH